MGIKICTGCGGAFPLDEFRVKVKAKGYRISKCQECDRMYRAQRYARQDKAQYRREQQRLLDARRQAVTAGLIVEPSTRVCPDCQRELPISTFAFKNESLLRRLSRCRDCQREHRLRQYRKDRVPYLKNNRRQRTKLQKIAAQAKNQPCQDCGCSFPACAMDFDHRDPKTKVAKISSMVFCGSKQLLLDEIAKCDVVCAICHRLRTNRQSRRHHE